MEEKKVMVELKHVDKFFGENHVVKDISLPVYQGEFLTILGSSGSGKTTTLRMIGGFDKPNGGEIFVAGANVAHKEPFERDVNTVFQNYALFPHMTVAENIAYGLRMKHVPKQEIKKRVNEMLELVQLKDFGPRQISELSGGQKQRIAIARAVVNDPKVLLLDEPLGALDLKLRKQMQFELKCLQKKLGITFIYVTHDQEEALSMSDRIAIMHDGCLEQVGAPAEIYERPVSKFVADFIGESNVFAGKIKSLNQGCAEIAAPFGTVQSAADGVKETEDVYVSIRPEKVSISSESQGMFSLKGRITEQIYRGATIRFVLSISGMEKDFKADMPSNGLLFTTGDEVYIHWAPQDAFLIREKLTGDRNTDVVALHGEHTEAVFKELSIGEKSI